MSRVALFALLLLVPAIVSSNLLGTHVVVVPPNVGDEDQRFVVSDLTGRNEAQSWEITVLGDSVRIWVHRNVALTDSMEYPMPPGMSYFSAKDLGNAYGFWIDRKTSAAWVRIIMHYHSSSN